MLHKKTTAAFLLLALCGGSLAAQEILTLQQCRSLALEYNKEIARADKQIEAAGYDIRSYRGNFFPNIKAVGAGMYSGTDGSFGIDGGNLPVLSVDAASGQMVPNGSYAYFPGLDFDFKMGGSYFGALMVEQPLYMGGKISAAYKLANIAGEASLLRRKLTRNEVIVSTDEAYMQAAKAKEMVKVARKYGETLNELLGNVESANRQGLSPQNDVLKVQVKLNESKLALRRAENGYRLATMNLCHYIGRPLTVPIEVADGFPPVPDEGQMMTGDISARPEFSLLDMQVKAARQQVKLSRSELLPQIALQGSYSYIHAMELNDRTLLKGGGFNAVVTVQVPIFHFGERINKVRSAKMKLEEAQIEQENKNELMMLELAQAANNLDEARLECELTEKSLEQAAENMRVSLAQYHAGLETLSNCLEAQALWQQAYATNVETRYQLHINYLKYLKANGRLADGE